MWKCKNNLLNNFFNLTFNTTFIFCNFTQQQCPNQEAILLKKMKGTQGSIHLFYIILLNSHRFLVGNKSIGGLLQRERL